MDALDRNFSDNDLAIPIQLTMNSMNPYRPLEAETQRSDAPDDRATRWDSPQTEEISTPYLSVIAPCYNESEGILEFHRRVQAVCEAVGMSFEIVLVNDGSQDDTWTAMLQLTEQHREVIGVNLARNFGQEKALAAGLQVSRGEMVLILDADLQDPPELLPQMLALIEDGADVVYGKRRSRRSESWFKSVTASLFYSLMSRVSEISVPRNSGCFRLIRRRVVDVLLEMPEQCRYLRGLISWVGFRQVPLVFDRDARLAGESHFPLKRMVALALDALTGFSTRPLRWAGWLAGGVFLISMIVLGWWIFDWINSGNVNPLLAVIWVVGGFTCCQLTALFILGEYVGRINEQVKRRPLYVIESIVSSRNRKQIGNGEMP